LGGGGWRGALAIPVLDRLKQDASLGYKVSSMPIWGT
jgi:hypothetical protein